MRTDLVTLSLRSAPHPGLSKTVISALQIVRADRVLPRVHAVHRPSLCFIVQGAKQVTVGRTVFRYRSMEFLFTSVDLPMTGQVIEAAPAKPYLCLVLEIDPSLVFELTTASAALAPEYPVRTEQAIFVGKRDEQLADAFFRLLQCSTSPLDAEVLAPGVIREITYRLLLGPYGGSVRAAGLVGGQTQRIAKAIERLKREYAKALRIEQLARTAGMSLSSFHDHFKRVTTLSPLQYQKQLRLQEARRLLLGDAGSAAEIGFQVGYESPSQFSREYARFFGLPPLSDAKRIAARGS
ncbi:MAG TPA: AraC family transcriptional regulator [Polyangiaceae bacterium]|nr:AraC family transcriptional regulator [Polyangiaceae bacterium]